MVENRKVNPWTWQDNFGISQAIETTLKDGDTISILPALAGG